MHNREQVKEYIKNYLSEAKEVSPILLAGEWGIGKTYLVREEILPELKNKGIKILYVSLNGVSSIEELEDAIVVSLLGGGNRLAQALGRCAGVAISKCITRDAIRESLRVVKKLFVTCGVKRTKSVAFVFDDIERCQLSVKRWSGYIDTLLEQYKCPIVFIGNEEKLRDWDEYWEIKEKVIRQTFVLKTSFDYSRAWLLDDVIQEKGRAIVDDMDGFTNKLCEVGEWVREQFGKSNFRAFQHCLWALSFQWERYGKIFDEEPKRCINFSLAFVLLSYCVQLNILSRTAWKLENKIKESLPHKGDEQDSHSENIHYTSILAQCPVLDKDLWKEGTEAYYLLTSSVWESLVFGECVDEEEIKELVKTASQQVWKRLYHFRSLTTNEVDCGLQKLEKQCERCDFSDLYEIRMVFGIIEHIRKCKYEVLIRANRKVECWAKQQESILRQYQHCVDRFCMQNQIDIFTSEVFEDVYQGYQIPNVDEADSLYKRMLDYARECQDRERTRYINQVMASKDLTQIISLLSNRRFSNQSVITDSMSSYVSAALLEAKGSNLSVFLIALNERYHMSSANGAEFLGPYISEVPAWEVIVKEIAEATEKLLNESSIDYLKVNAMDVVSKKIQEGVIKRIKEHIERTPLVVTA